MAKEQLQAALINAGQVLNSTLDLNSVLISLIDEIRTVLKATGGSILLLDLLNNELIFVATVVPDDQAFISGTRLPAGKGIAGWVVQNKQAILVNDAQQDPHFYAGVDDLTGLTTRPLLAVPLLFNERAIGVIEVINKTRGKFNQQDLEALEILASSAAVAIENARLHELYRAITVSLRLTDIYHSFSKHAALLFPYNWLFILLEEDTIRIVHKVGDEKEKDEIENFLPENESLSREDPVVGVISRGQSQFRNFLSPIKLPGSFVGDVELAKRGIRSYLIVPLSVKGKIIGTWGLFSRQVNAYQADDRKVVQAMADQLAITIENARLFEQVQISRKELLVAAQEVVSAQKEERRQLLYEFQDKVSQHLINLKTDLNLIRASLPIEARALQQEAVTLADTILESLHFLVEDLSTPTLPQLSSREQEVLNLIVEGETNKTMADILHISVKTVEKHRANLMKKLRVHNVVDLIKVALKHQL